MTKKIITLIMATLILTIMGCDLLFPTYTVENVVATADTKDSITITWDIVETGATYSILGCETEDGDYKTLGETTGLTFSYDVDNIKLVPETGTTYYFVVRYRQEGETAWERDEAPVNDSAVFPVKSPKIKSLEADIDTDYITGDYVNVDMTMELITGEDIDSFKFFYKYDYQDAADDYSEWTSSITPVTSADNKTVTFDFRMTTRKDGYCRDGRSVSYKVEAYDVDDNLLDTKIIDKDIDMYTEVFVVETDVTGDVLTVYFTGSSLANRYKFEVSGTTNAPYEYGVSDLDTALDSDLGTPSSEYSVIYKKTFTITDLSGSHTITVTPGRTSDSTWKTAGSQTDSFYK